MIYLISITVVPIIVNANMNKEQLREKLAEIEHNQWVEWSKSLHENENLSGGRIDRWSEMWVPYSELTEEQKDQDRKYADIVLKEFDSLLSTLEKEVKKGKFYCDTCRERPVTAIYDILSFIQRYKQEPK